MTTLLDIKRGLMCHYHMNEYNRFTTLHHRVRIKIMFLRV
jgi:hypothetical protein